ncbi:MAG: cysteine hydrolase [Clostridium sp.]|nr:cysteine hydrolase [Clostridium sp.]
MKLDFNCSVDFNYLKSIENSDFKIDTKTVLFVIDMNNGFAKKGALYSERVQNIIPEIVHTVNTFANLNAPIISFTDSHNKDSIEFKEYPEHCLKNTDESQLIDELDVFKDKMIVIPKNSTNGFLEDKAQIEIKKLIDSDYKNWVVTGCCTDICIKQFSETLKTYFNKENLDLNVIVPITAVETYDGPMHNADTVNLFSIAEMHMNGIKIVNRIK